VALGAIPAAARDFVQDQAGMFSGATVSQLNQRIGSFNAQTGKEVVVVTVPSLNGSTLNDAAQTAFTQQNVNGVLIFIARDDRRDIILPDRAGAQAGWFTPDVLRSIRQAMESQFRAESYDAGVTTAVDGVLNVYRAHVGSQRNTSSSSAGMPMTTPAGSTSGGFHISMFWWIIIIVVGFLILRSVMRAMSGPRMYGGPPGPGMPGGYGPGYGPGYGGYGGGGSFWSGLLGGLGGAWLGNEIFGGRGGAVGPADAGQVQGGGWGGDQSGASGAGWQSDAGQADMSGSSGGDWSGGGFGGGGDSGGGDSGGGFGGGDFGGGGGDSGGGW
jgi:uncharacterized membrane protein YgcG